MRLLRLDDVSLGRNDLVFRQSATAALAGSAGLIAGAALMVFAAARGAFPSFVASVAGGSLLLMAALTAVAARRALSPGNWLLATDGERIYVKFRSYLNAKFPADVPQVVELVREDIVSVNVARVNQTGRSRSGDSLNERSEYLDIELSSAIDMSALRERLASERAFHTRGSAWKHYPATLVGDNVLRVEWRGKHARVRPALREALDALRWVAEVAATRDEQIELGARGSRPDYAESQRAIRMLAEQGKIIEATLLAERSLGITTTEARQLIDRITTHDAGARRIGETNS